MTPEELAALLADLAAADEAALRAAHEQLGTEITELRASAKTLADAERLRELRKNQEAIHADLQRRADEAQAVQDALDATKDGLEPPAAPAPKAEGGGDGGDDNNDDDPDNLNDDNDDDDADAKREKELVTAAARAKARGEQPKSDKTAGERKPEKFVWTAAAGQAKIDSGSKLDRNGLTDLFNDARSKAMTHPSEYVVASIPDYQRMGVEVLDQRDGVVRSDQIVKGIQARWAKEHELAHQPERVTAAICEPLEVIRELAPFQGVTDTPFADVFPQAPMARLGVRLTKRTWALADMDAGFTFPWANQGSVDEATPSTWKPCITIPCPTTFDITAEELTACFKVQDDVALSSPETVDDFQELLFVQRARRREQYLMAKFDAHADTINYQVSENVFNSGVDALPKLSEVILTALGHAQYPNRINLNVYTLVMPPNAEKVLKIGRMKKAFGDEQITTGEIETRIRAATGVGNIVWLRDNRNGGVGGQPQTTAQAAAADGNPEPVPADGFLDTLNSAYRVRLVSPGDAIYGVTGEMQTGLQTDPQLIRQNMQQWFLKEWVGFGKNGANPWFTIDFGCLIGNGGYVGFLTPLVCTSAS